MTSGNRNSFLVADAPDTVDRVVHGPHFALGPAIAAVVLSAFSAFAQTIASVQPASELKKLSLEELFDMEVTSVSRKSEKLSETAAAIHVVTGDDIRRSAALSIPEALRDVPGVEVARLDSNRYAITARGFNGTVANKLLVLMDGRTVYTPLFSGVFWDAQDTLMEDISRIEVIRGPGATVWGANAVNGVINILSKSAEETQGILLTGGAGNEEQGFGGVRYGGRIASNTYFRVYGKYFSRDESVFANGQDAGDRFQMGQGGFRIDSKPSTSNGFTLQGDFYGGTTEAVAADVDIGGGNLLGRWTRTISPDSDLRLQVYYDRTDRTLPAAFDEKLDTYDVDFQHRFPAGRRNDIVWGAAYRVTRDNVNNSPALAFLPSPLTQNLYTGFAQDEIKLIENRLHLTLGSKFEHNDYTGIEYQPSLRLTWTPTTAQTVWAAVSRAVRAPSRIDRDLFAPGAPPFFLKGGRDFDSEVLHAFELGYKIEPRSDLTASVAAFYNSYEKLRSVEAGPPAFLSNGLDGRASGAEVEVSYQPLHGWRLSAGYTFIDLELRLRPGSTDTTQVRQEGDSPRHSFFVRSWLDLPHELEFDLTARHIDDLPNQQVAEYTAVDMRIGWKATKNLELAVVGGNLLDSRHAEFGTPASRREIERSVYGQIRCRF